MSESPRPSGECRCLCGSLLARRVERGVELKCRRCKRILLVPWTARGGARPAAGPGRAGAWRPVLEPPQR